MTETTTLQDGGTLRFTLRKSAKLRHRTLVQELFRRGKSVYSGPLRITYRTLGGDELTSSFREHVPDRIGPVQMMITVPKKKRRHAVDRVLMRRRIREAFRLKYHPLRDLIANHDDMRTLSVAIVYMQSENCPYTAIEAAMASAIRKIIKRLNAPGHMSSEQEASPGMQESDTDVKPNADNHCL